MKRRSSEMQKQNAEASNWILLDFLFLLSLLDLTVILTQFCGCTVVHIITLWSRHCPVNQKHIINERKQEEVVLPEQQQSHC